MTWACPKCGREFKNNRQNHFCGEIKTIADYIVAQDEQVRPLLQQVYQAIRTTAPKATEKISWQMPTFHQQENLIHFAAFKNHLGIYPGAEAIEVFAKQLKPYHTSKGAIQFPYSQPLDLELIKDITVWRVQQIEQD